MLINILLIVAIIIFGSVLLGYNNLVRGMNKVKQCESDIDVLLKQRFDLIPNIVNTVKGYTSHENGTLTELTSLRSNYQDKNHFNSNEINKIDTSINNVLALAESYPELKADVQFLSLQNNLNAIENKIQIIRSRYNYYVTSYNNKVETVPTNIFAKIFGFEKMNLFKLENEKERENVKIEI